MNPRAPVAPAFCLALALAAPAAAQPKPAAVAAVVEPIGGDVTLGNHAVHDVATSGSAAQLKKLLAEQPAERDAKNVRNATPLHFAALNPDVGVLKALLAAGAGVNLQDDDGNTALHMAAFARKTEAALLLLEAGADVNLKTKAGRTPLAMAEKARADETAGVIALWVLKGCKPGQGCGIGAPRPVQKLVK